MLDKRTARVTTGNSQIDIRRLRKKGSFLVRATSSDPWVFTKKLSDEVIEAVFGPEDRRREQRRIALEQRAQARAQPKAQSAHAAP